ncbi:MAG: hypothetical protein J1E97_06740 [Muribaculaceae bacterium]|nr:hypothetical protein [Muribaculaceae bacterium]
MKRRTRFRVKFYDEARLVDRGGFSVTWLGVAAIAIVVAAFFICIGIGVVWFSPIKNRLPGYMPPGQRAQTEEAYRKVDSLQQLYTTQQRYLDNLVNVLNTTRDPEVPDTVGRALPFKPDSLLVSSEIEREFLRKMEEAGYIITVNRDYDDTDTEE